MTRAAKETAQREADETSRTLRWKHARVIADTKPQYYFKDKNNRGSLASWKSYVENRKMLAVCEQQ